MEDQHDNENIERQVNEYFVEKLNASFPPNLENRVLFSPRGLKNNARQTERLDTIDENRESSVSISSDGDKEVAMEISPSPTHITLTEGSGEYQINEDDRKSNETITDNNTLPEDEIFTPTQAIAPGEESDYEGELEIDDTNIDLNDSTVLGDINPEEL